MKLVIQTQLRENYGAHDWDGEGTCPQYWKFKGGNTYVVRDLTDDEISRITIRGIPTLRGLIEVFDDYWEEHIVSHEIVEDSAFEINPIESPIILTYSKGEKEWYASRTHDNGIAQYTPYRSGIIQKFEQWYMDPKGERRDYVSTFLMEDGRMVNYAELQDWFDSKRNA